VTGETETEISATFASRAEAEAAVAVLAAAGIPQSAIEVREAELPPQRQREGRYLWRLLVIIVLWSVLGGVFGVLFGLVLAATIGPEGTTGLVFQAVCWGIVGHLTVGMLAGYVVLADRSQREMEPERPEIVVSVSSVAEDIDRVKTVLEGSQASPVKAPPSSFTFRR
jgi:hypothetical protein